MGLQRQPRLVFKLLSPCVQVDWEEYYVHYVRTLLRLDDRTIEELKTSPQTVSRPIKVGGGVGGGGWGVGGH